MPLRRARTARGAAGADALHRRRRRRPIDAAMAERLGLSVVVTSTAEHGPGAIGGDDVPLALVERDRLRDTLASRFLAGVPRAARRRARAARRREDRAGRSSRRSRAPHAPRRSASSSSPASASRPARARRYSTCDQTSCSDAVSSTSRGRISSASASSASRLSVLAEHRGDGGTLTDLAEGAESLVPLPQRRLGRGVITGEQLDVGAAERRGGDGVETRTELLVRDDGGRHELTRLRRTGLARATRQPIQRRQHASMHEIVRRRLEQRDAQADAVVHRERARPGGEAEPADDLRLLPAVARRLRRASAPGAAPPRRARPVPPRARARARPGTSRARASRCSVGDRGQAVASSAGSAASTSSRSSSQPPRGIAAEPEGDALDPRGEHDGLRDAVALALDQPRSARSSARDSSPDVGQHEPELGRQLEPARTSSSPSSAAGALEQAARRMDVAAAERAPTCP